MPAGWDLEYAEYIPCSEVVIRWAFCFDVAQDHMNRDTQWDSNSFM